MFQAIQSLRDESARIIGRQFLRSATSIGANLEEAFAAESTADSIHKNSIALKEAGESLYWLRLLERKILAPESDVTELVCETNEVILIISAIIVNTRKNAPSHTG